MMDTVLNLGLTPRTVEGLVNLSGDARFAWDAYRRFLASFAILAILLIIFLFRPRYSRGTDVLAAVAAHGDRVDRRVDHPQNENGHGIRVTVSADASLGSRLLLGLLLAAPITAPAAEPVEYAVKGMNSVMPTIVRVSSRPYRWKIGVAQLSDVANVEKKMPRDFITPDGFHITTKCRNYLSPLIGGEAFPTSLAAELRSLVPGRLLSDIVRSLPAQPVDLPHRCMRALLTWTGRLPR